MKTTNLLIDLMLQKCTIDADGVGRWAVDSDGVCHSTVLHFVLHDKCWVWQCVRIHGV